MWVVRTRDVPCVGGDTGGDVPCVGGDTGGDVPCVGGEDCMWCC